MKQNKGFFNKSIHNSLSQDTTKPKTQSNLTPKPSHKKLKIFAGTSLALFMGISTLCGVFLAPTSTPSLSTSSTSSATSPLGLNPETDPVVYTTSTGLEIKYANALTNPNLAGYTYFTLGTQTDTTTNTTYPINWVIIGYNDSLSPYVFSNTDQSKGKFDQIVGYDRIDSYYDSIDYTPAGMAIKKDLFAISDKAVQSGELPEDAILCISECILYTGIICPSQYSNFVNGTGHNNLLSWFENNTELYNYYLKGHIIDQEYTVHVTYGWTPQFVTTTSPIFIPGGVSVDNTNFNLHNYLQTPQSRIAYNLSGQLAVYGSSTSAGGYAAYYHFNTSGTLERVNVGYNSSGSTGYRPIMICKFF